MILRNELIKFYEAMHIKMGMTVDVPCGISIIEDVDTYLEQLKLNVVGVTFCAICDEKNSVEDVICKKCNYSFRDTD
tara:strand:+ start:100 stop:330 length:231 start_codon:yes stop_codon:yes gene_type:complete